MSIKRSRDPKVLTVKTCAYCGGPSGPLGLSSGSCPQPISASKLSQRERQIVELVRKAKSNKEIAYELGLTVGTVKEYVFHIFRKLGVTNRTELALWGREYEQTEVVRHLLVTTEPASQKTF